MSKIALSGNASGTGTLTIAAPNTNSNYTLTLPAETGTVTTSESTPTFTGAVTAPGFIPNSSTVPTNGLYLPATNTPAWASNSTKVVSVIKGSSLALEGATPQAGTGVTFPATQSASTDANTLDDYEEGTWTPTDASGANLSLTVTGASYVKIGKQVTAWLWITYPSTANGSNASIGSLPFTVGAYPMVGAGVSGYTSYTSTVTAYPIYTTTYANLVRDGGTSITNANLSTKELRMCLFYTV